MNPDLEAPAVQQLSHQVKQIERHRRADDVVVQEFGDVKSDGRLAREPRHHPIVRVVEHRRVLAARQIAPARQARMSPLWIRGIQKLDEPRQPAHGSIERHSPPQRLIEVRLFPCGERDAPSNEEIEPGLQELDVPTGRGKLKRVETRRLAIAQGLIGSTERPHQDLTSPVFVEEHLGQSIAARKPMQTDLPEPVGPQMKVCPVSRRLPPSGSLGSLAWSEK